MSYQATEAFRDWSNSKGAVRTVGFVMSTYADEHGHGIYPAISTLAKQARVSRSTAIVARQWFVDHGEAVVTGSKPSRTKSPIPELSFAPLLKGPEIGPLDEKGPDTTPLGSGETTLKGPESEQKGPEIGPEPEGNHPTKPEDEAAAAEATSSPDLELGQLVARIFAAWQRETDNPDARLTDSRRRAIERGFEHYDGDELFHAIRNWRLSPFHRGDNQTGKKFNDLVFLLKDDDTIEELRALRPSSTATTSKGVRNPILAAICDRPAEQEDDNERRARIRREQGLPISADQETEEERRARYAKYDAKVEEVVVVPSLTPAQLRAEHQEQTENLRAVEDRLAKKPSDYLRTVAEEAKTEIARLEAESPDLFGGEAAPA